MMFHLLQRRLEFLESRSYRRQQFQSLFGDLHAPSATPEQGHLDISLQRLDLLADGRRCDIERISGFRKAQVRGNRLEYAQRSQWQSVVRGWHFKLSLTVDQGLNLFVSGAEANLCTVDSILQRSTYHERFIPCRKTGAGSSRGHHCIRHRGRDSVLNGGRLGRLRRCADQCVSLLLVEFCQLADAPKEGRKVAAYCLQFALEAGHACEVGGDGG